MLASLKKKLTPIVAPLRPDSVWMWLIYVMALGFGISYSIMGIVRHETFHTGIWDMGVYEHVVWNLANGNGFASSVSGFNFLGDHLAFGLIFIAPLYAVFPSTWTLLIVQAMMVGLCAIPAYFIARRHVGDGLLAFALGGAYICMLGVGYPLLFDFHVELLAMLPLLIAINLLEAKQWGWMVAALLVALSMKEEIFLIIACFGIYLLFARKFRLGIGLIVLALVYVVVGYLIISPMFRVAQESQIPPIIVHYLHLGDTPLQVLRTILLRPIFAISESYIELKGLTVWQLLWPLLFLPLLGPRYWLLAAPILILNYYSSRFAQFSVWYQYLTIALPGLYASAVLGASRLRGWSPDHLMRPLSSVIGVLVMGVSVVSLGTQARYHWNSDTFIAPDNAAAMRTAIELIPPDARVAATDKTGAHLAGRSFLYFSVPFAYDYEYRELVNVPDYVNSDYVLIQEFDPAADDEDKRLDELLHDPEYDVIYAEDGIFLFRAVAMGGSDS